MPSTRKEILHDQMINGVDMSTAPHLVDSKKWILAKGVRTYNGAVRQLPWLYSHVDPGDVLPEDLQAIVAIPVSDNGEILHVGLGVENVWQLNFLTPVNSELLTLPDGTAPVFGTKQTGHDLWSHTFYNGQVFFANRHNPVHYTDGTLVGTYEGESPKPRFLDHFFDHLIACNSVWKGNLEPYVVRWSDLYNFAQWEELETNEADFRDIREWCGKEDEVNGITGCGRVGDLFVIYTPSSIVGMRYVGLPKVMQFFPIVEGIGNGLPHGLARHKNMHFFFDVNEMNFYQYTPGGIEKIGDPVADRMEENWQNNYATPKSYRVMVIPERTEVWWTIWNESQNAYDLYIYDWEAKEWAVDTLVYQITSTGGFGKRAETVKNLSGQVNALAGDVNGLSVTIEDVRPRLFTVAGTQQAYREELPADLTSGFLTKGGTYSPMLETPDRYFGTLSKVKELNGITIDATWTAGTCNGILVELSARERLGDAVTYSKVGVWKNDLRDNFLSFPRPVAGKIFRWRFTPLGPTVRDFRWYSFTEHVYFIEAER